MLKDIVYFLFKVFFALPVISIYKLLLLFKKLNETSNEMLFLNAAMNSSILSYDL
jgi:hypothetical protein